MNCTTRLDCQLGDTSEALQIASGVTVGFSVACIIIVYIITKLCVTTSSKKSKQAESVSLLRK